MGSGSGQDKSTSRNGGTKGSGPAGSRAGEVLSEIYRLVRRIGRGGMGEIYEAEHVHLQSRSAVKILTRASVESTEVLKRFTREAQIAARLNSENIVRTFDFGRDADGVPYAVMELLDGEDLAQRLKRVGRLTPAQWAPLLTQVASALSLAHGEGIVHRDLKPENIFLHRPDSWREEAASDREDTRPGFGQPARGTPVTGTEDTRPGLGQPFGADGVTGTEDTRPGFLQPFGEDGVTGTEDTRPGFAQPGLVVRTAGSGVSGKEALEATLEDVETAMKAEAARMGWGEPVLGEDGVRFKTAPETKDDGFGSRINDPAATQVLADAVKGHLGSRSGSQKPAPGHQGEEVVKILDFGISKLRDAMSAITRDRECLGTPQYMSPEQAGEGAAQVDHRTDIFSLGTITYEVLSGSVPFTAPTPMGILYTICHEPVVPLRQAAPYLSPLVCKVVDRALAKRPEDRFQSAEEMARQFADAVEGVGAVDGSVEIGTGAAPPVAREMPPQPSVVADDPPPPPAAEADVPPPPAEAAGDTPAPTLSGYVPPPPAIAEIRPPVAPRRRSPPSGARALLTGAMLATAVALLCVGVYLLLKRAGSTGPDSRADRSANRALTSEPKKAVPDASVPATTERVSLTLANLPPGSFAEVRVNGALHEERPVRLPKGIPCRIRVTLPAHEPHEFNVTPTTDIIYRLAMVPSPEAPIWNQPEPTPPPTATPPPGEPRPVRATRRPRRVRPAGVTPPPPRKPAVRKPPARKPPARKPAAGSPPARKRPAGRPPSRKPPARKPPRRKPGGMSSVSKVHEL